MSCSCGSLKGWESFFNRNTTLVWLNVFGQQKKKSIAWDAKLGHQCAVELHYPYSIGTTKWGVKLSTRQTDINAYSTCIVLNGSDCSADLDMLNCWT